MPQLRFIEKNGVQRLCDFSAGETVLVVARRGGLTLEGVCEGAMSCATCHVFVAAQDAGRLVPPRSGEVAMLNLARDAKPTSRLGCQIVLRDEDDGLTVEVA